jgi:uncharacterized protein with GYD domain
VQEEEIMAHYLTRGSYTQMGIEGFLKEGGTARYAFVEKLVASQGGRLICLYWAFGDDDFIAVTELPDNAAAASLALNIGASGAASVKTTVLLTAAEADEAVSRRVVYRPPGG